MGEEAHSSLLFDILDSEDLSQVFDTLATIHAYSLQTNSWKKLLSFPMGSFAKYIDSMKEMFKASSTIPLLVERGNISVMDELIKNIDALMDVQILDSVAKNMG
ncbi:unnamed protein product [Gongylonema pulchrum]|uniref:F-box/LRR-repeat protein n=1 Tax=Gongylonema pulchrum TaxID=637853 RepID=A0A183EDY8_9BILA|nr:unnamed protein product [Gongylonema pulchrum]